MADRALHSDAAAPLYSVADEHQMFVHMLLKLGIPLAAVREIGGSRLDLAIQCDSLAQAEQRTDEIARELLIRRPTMLLVIKLGEWKARRVGKRVLVFWTGIEVERHMIH